ncbi:hypothetical protein QBC34DRAFT_340660 [Podospora aff. communis PSN243]|uniref:DUF302 domain-containing protein n=1 Tax=Podospora aff. communis PSN243 TaxID=3040156 RepID=A0AAV9H5I5_9PEZI|nr:hypothetical protein QBC34DRAFT_340660 [Podospora aff. communis PSN243]
MRLFHLLNAIASLAIIPLTVSATPSPGPKPPKPPQPISDRRIHLTHRTILSSRSFNETRTALESAIPPLNTTFVALFAQGNSAGAAEALRALPPLSSFIVPPRNFGVLVTVWGDPAEKAVQYEIGNPLTASKFVRFQLGASLYAPIRVSLFEEPEGVVQFAFDTPTSMFGSFGDKRLKETAEALEEELTELLLFAAGHPSSWTAPSS